LFLNNWLIKFEITVSRYAILQLLVAVGLLAQNGSLTKPMVDDYDNYTIVGELGLTVTNFGIIGEGWNNPNQPSCRYKQYGTPREQVELMSYGGLWIGAIPVVNGQEQPPRVSTAIVDGVFNYGEEGFEFTTSPSTGDTIQIRSSISSTSTSPLARYFSLNAVSHQDLIAHFSDRRTSWSNPDGSGGTIPNHTPLGLDIRLEAYAWSYSFMESFVILDYTIVNSSPLIDGLGWDLKNLYVGLWADASINNMNYRSRWEPGSGFTWYDNINGFDRSYDANGYPRDIAYQFDYDGDDGWSQVYFGLKVLYGPGKRARYVGDPEGDWEVYYNQWRWNLAENQNYPYFNMPIDDAQRYEKLSSSPFYDGSLPQEEPWMSDPNSWMMLLSAGPFGTIRQGEDWILPPGDSVHVVFAVVAAPWSHTGLSDDFTRRADLRANADWAQKAFNGEDLNGNGELDPGEDLNGNGVLDRYIIPEPPPSPNLLIVPGDGEVTLYWDNSPEYAQDPLSRKRDFAGYRIYGGAKTQGNMSQYSLLAEFDLKGDGVGYDTGFDLIRIKGPDGRPDSVLIKGHYYHYKWTDPLVHSGWPDRSLYAVTAFDRGDAATGLASLESSRNDNRTLVIPGTPPDSVGQYRVTVYPNPYRARAMWDGGGARERLLWFRNLPPRAIIRIYTLSGDLVDVIEHDAATYRGEDVRNLAQRSGARQRVLAGGEHAWDLISRHDQAIAAGLYYFTVENQENHRIQVGKFLVIK